MSDLAKKQCVPCKGGVPALSAQQQDQLLAQLADGWMITDRHHLERELRFANFRQPLELTLKVGELAEREGHHPEIRLSWGRLHVCIWTHQVNGLTENDFVLAAKIDELVRGGETR